ncbi:sugar kinase [Brachyspira hampsonii]|uniref:2-keto-3-deoxygluconate kinase n=1 Tax=Brachyspira hampsonii 30446 TaxID=1289135 RepID=A0A2U4EV08_9SPIR|nr:sugar kinase [Brachyspira hampsonii]EKV56505.1 2-keto-3-deoxygluconate kinase [Brachyspira hampsonii 30446]MBW5390096.1 sugar kinase [Brachyspira hampsonii]MBW5395256.1 sugar kinase [Brachyspira hampsonii]OEJ19597.1 2-dehydro-3-deoxygluconokinase [Brachyspira hampsonii]
MASVITFGEIMLRLSPPSNLRFVQANSYDVRFGGGEANVAFALSNFGVDASFVTKLPNNDIGQACINELRRYGVDVSNIVFGGERIGIYFLEKGASQRGSKVIYDRANSSISKCTKEDFDWDKIFDEAKWFHLTGITPALGKNVSEVCIEACKKAKEKNITISLDLNYRKKLWTSKEANETMSRLMPYVDICIANEEDAEKVFGIKAKDSNIIEGKLSHEGYKDVAKEIVNRFKVKKVGIALRGSISASENLWSCMLYNGEEYFFSKEYLIKIVDRVGGGDSFAAGLIYSLLNGKDDREALEFAAAASCLKHSIDGDFNIVTVDEVMTVYNGDASGRIQR